MKFSSGFLLGAAVGGYIIYNMNEEQRSKVAATAGGAIDKVRGSSVANSVSSNVSEVAGAASGRVTDAVDQAGSAITDKVESSDEPTHTTPTAGASGTTVT